MRNLTQRYISEELTHFLGRKLASDDERFSLLKRILRTGRLRPGPGRARMSVAYRGVSSESFSTNLAVIPEAICFCDIPLQDLGMHAGKYGRFGLAFPKVLLAHRGANPVFYIDKTSRTTPKEEETRQQFFDRALKDYAQLFERDLPIVLHKSGNKGSPSYDRYSRFRQVQLLMGFEVLCFLKFFDSNLPDDHPDNYYMEREWRVLGGVDFTLDEVTRVLVPAVYSRRLRAEIPSFSGQVSFL